MDKIKYYWIKTIRTITSRKTVLALLQINVSFFFDSEEIYTWFSFRKPVTQIQKLFEQVHLKFKIYTEKFCKSSQQKWIIRL